MSGMHDVTGNQFFGPDDLNRLRDAFDIVCFMTTAGATDETKELWRDRIARIVIHFASEGYRGDDLVERASEVVLTLQKVEERQH